MELIKRVFFDRATGRIKTMTECPADNIPDVVGPPEWIVVDHIPDPEKEYVMDNALAARPLPSCSINVHQLTNVPVPATVYIDGTAYPTNEATVDLDLPTAGRYSVLVAAWPMQSRLFIVEA